MLRPMTLSLVVRFTLQEFSETINTQIFVTLWGSAILICSLKQIVCLKSTSVFCYIS